MARNKDIVRSLTKDEVVQLNGPSNHDDFDQRFNKDKVVETKSNQEELGISEAFVTVGHYHHQPKSENIKKINKELGDIEVVGHFHKQPKAKFEDLELKK